MDKEEQIRIIQEVHQKYNDAPPAYIKTLHVIETLMWSKGNWERWEQIAYTAYEKFGQRGYVVLTIRNEYPYHNANWVPRYDVEEIEKMGYDPEKQWVVTIMVPKGENEFDSRVRMMNYDHAIHPPPGGRDIRTTELTEDEVEILYGAK